MEDILIEIMANYLTEKQSPLKENALARFIRHTAPVNIRKKASLMDTYQITGGVGVGGWPEIPWIGIFDKQITTSAERGYYIAYLFRSDMSGVYLSLNMGWTQFKNKFKATQLAKQRIAATADKCQEILQSDVGEFSTQTINLLTNRELGVGYELGHICGKYYPWGGVPDDRVLVDDLRNLIGVYRELKGLLKTQNITTLIDVIGDTITSEDEAEDAKYNREVQKASPKDVPSTPQEKPPHTTYRGQKRWRTDPGIGMTCIIAADFRCEVDSTHDTFVSRVTGKNFVEAHHLIPMSYQEEFDNSLDVPANVIALCPNCHRLLHHAAKEATVTLLSCFLSERDAAMERANISLPIETLGRYYGIR